jgi:hypothetical protein
LFVFLQIKIRKATPNVNSVVHILVFIHPVHPL